MKTPTYRAAAAVVGAILLGASAGAELPFPRFEGKATTVAVSGGGARVAVLRGSRLEIFDAVDAAKPALTLTLPVEDGRLEEFHGNTVTYATTLPHRAAPVHVAMDLSDVDLLTWPNEGLGEVFPDQPARLTLDGRGLYGMLTLTPEVRAFFGIPQSTPDGARVMATYRFVKETMLARASTDFRDGVALSPDDTLLTLRDGGLMRYGPKGREWTTKGQGTPVRILDVDPAVRRALVLRGDGVLLGVDLASGAVAWQWKGEEGKAVAASGMLRDARLVPGGEVLLLLRTGDVSRLAALAPAGGQLLGDVLPPGPDAAMMRGRWAAEDGDLGEVWPVATPVGPAVLLQGPDGWYVVPLPTS